MSRSWPGLKPDNAILLHRACMVSKSRGNINNGLVILSSKNNRSQKQLCEIEHFIELNMFLYQAKRAVFVINLILFCHRDHHLHLRIYQ